MISEKSIIFSIDTQALICLQDETLIQLLRNAAEQEADREPRVTPLTELQCIHTHTHSQTQAHTPLTQNLTFGLNFKISKMIFLKFLKLFLYVNPHSRTLT